MTEKEIIYFSCNNESEIEDILDDLITYSDPNKIKNFIMTYILKLLIWMN